MNQLLKSAYTPPCCRVISVYGLCQVLNDSTNRNRVNVDYDDEEIGLS